MARRRKIQTQVTNRRNVQGLEQARTRYIERAIKQGRTKEIAYSQTKQFEKDYRREVRQNIRTKTNQIINKTLNEQKGLGAEGRQLYKQVIKGNSKIGTKAALERAKKIRKQVKKQGLKKFLKRRKFTRQIPKAAREQKTALGLLQLQTRTDFYYRERDLILKYNNEVEASKKGKAKRSTVRKLKVKYKVSKQEERTKYLEELALL